MESKLADILKKSKQDKRDKDMARATAEASRMLRSPGATKETVARPAQMGLHREGAPLMRTYG